MEIRIKSVNKGNSHSWFKNFNNKEQDDNEQETTEVQFEEYASILNAGDFASRPKATAKPQKRDSDSSSTRTIPSGERTCTDVEPGKDSLSDYPVS